jgi:ABC-type nitrate/sulfonate/bicarbonate transport system substrate-binding protein
MIEMLTGADVPINGFVTTSQYIAAHPEVLLKLLHIWFRCVRFVESDKDKGAQIIIGTLNRYSAANFTVKDFERYWSNYEHYPANPQAVQELILDSGGKTTGGRGGMTATTFSLTLRTRFRHG